MTDMRAFITSLPNAAEPDAARRAANEREINRRVGALPPADRAKFESTLRDMAHEQHKSMSFSAKWADANRAQQLKRQITQEKKR